MIEQKRGSLREAAMRTARLKAPTGFTTAHYLCVSRVVERRFAFGEEEKEQFVELMRRYERFCEVRVLTFCVMSNHFHILVEVPARPAEALGDGELCARLDALGPEAGAGSLRQLLERVHTTICLSLSFPVPFLSNNQSSLKRDRVNE